jgi:predicted Rossmann fold flavoprotein
VRSSSLVVATGGLSIPRMGATGFGFDLAQRFGLKVIETAPALDGFTLSGADLELARALAGLSADCIMSAGGLCFRENLLFTHVGLSGPASLQASLHWRAGQELAIDLLPDLDVLAWLKDAKNSKGRSQARSLVAEKLPQRLAEALCDRVNIKTGPLAEAPNHALEALARQLKDWRLKPSGTVGYSKAEVTRGGVDTDELSSQTMEAKRVPGLYFIGEVVDVTGWLGGYNFQWAWASGWAAGQSV